MLDTAVRFGEAVGLQLPDVRLQPAVHAKFGCLGEARADAFTIVRIAGHGSVTVSQRCVHPTPEGLERASNGWRI